MAETTTSSSSTTTSSTTQGYPVIECVPDMEVLHQVSGQCWNDAAIVFLWFSSGIGPIIQQRLQEKTILDEFQHWANLPQIQQNIFEVFPDSAQNYSKFAYELKQYLQKLQERYFLLLSVTAPKRKKNIHQRRLSTNLSLFLEKKGIEVSGLLYSNSRKCGMPGFSGFGFYHSIFGNVLYVLIHFLLQGRIRVLLFHNDESVSYGDLLKSQTAPVFIHNFYGKEFIQETEILPIHATSIFKNIEKDFRLSFQAMATQRLNGKVGGNHVITFLTCEDGNAYFFDDNTFELTKINWPILFKDNEFKKTTLLYIPSNTKIPSTFRNEALPSEGPFLVLLHIDTSTELLILEKSDETKEGSLYVYDIDNTDGKFTMNTLHEEGFEFFYVVREIGPILFSPGRNEMAETLNFEFLNERSISNKKILAEKEKFSKSILNKADPFTIIVQRGDIESLKKILSEGKSQKELDTMLIEAANYPTLEILQELIKAGANPRANNDTALINAIRNNYYDIGEFLLAAGADINTKNGALLHDAIHNDDTFKLKWVINHRADINIDNGKILRTVIRKGGLYCNLIVQLLEYGAQILPFPETVMTLLTHKDFQRLFDCINVVLDATTSSQLQTMLARMRQDMLKQAILNMEFLTMEHLLKTGASLTDNDDEILKIIASLTPHEKFIETIKTLLGILNPDTRSYTLISQKKLYTNTQIQEIQKKLRDYRAEFIKSQQAASSSSEKAVKGGRTRDTRQNSARKRKSKGKQKTRKH